MELIYRNRANLLPRHQVTGIIRPSREAYRRGSLPAFQAHPPREFYT